MPDCKNKPEVFQKITKSIKYSIYGILILSLVAAVMYLNIFYTKPDNQYKPIAITNEVLILNKTASIISRDGNIPLKVAKRYSIWIFEAAAEYSLDPILLLSVIYTESKFNYKAISPTGPIGLFQIASSYHKEKTTKAALFDPKNNIMVGAWILREYADRSKSTIETLLRYNGSLGEAPHYATKVMTTKYKYEREIMKAISL